MNDDKNSKSNHCQPQRLNYRQRHVWPHQSRQYIDRVDYVSMWFNALPNTLFIGVFCSLSLSISYFRSLARSLSCSLARSLFFSLFLLFLSRIWTTSQNHAQQCRNKLQWQLFLISVILFVVSIHRRIYIASLLYWMSIDSIYICSLNFWCVCSFFSAVFISSFTATSDAFLTTRSWAQTHANHSNV